MASEAILNFNRAFFATRDPSERIELFKTQFGSLAVSVALSRIQSGNYPADVNTMLLKSALEKAHQKVWYESEGAIWPTFPYLFDALDRVHLQNLVT